MKKMCFYFFANAREKLLSQRTNDTFGFANTQVNAKTKRAISLPTLKRVEIILNQ